MSGNARSPASIEVARRILSRDAVASGATDPAVAAAALQRACSRVVEHLCDSMGEDGCSALVARALKRAEPGHAPLKTAGRMNGKYVHVDRVAASVEAHGIAATTAAVEAFLSALVDLLGKLIGEDMATRIIEQDDLLLDPPAGGAQP